MVNSRQGSFAAAQYLRTGQPLLRTYGLCFAEFLNEGSSDHLSAFTPTYLCWFAVRAAAGNKYTTLFREAPLLAEAWPCGRTLPKYFAVTPEGKTPGFTKVSQLHVLRRISHMSWQALELRHALYTLLPAQEYQPAVHRLRISASA